MKYCGFISLLLAGIHLSAQISDDKLPERPSPPRLVNDLANILTPSQEAELEQKLDALDDSTSTQIVVITVNTVEPYAIEDYALYLGRKWGVGQKDKDNGIVFLTAVDDHNVTIQTGYGVEEYITDARSKRIIENDVIPNYKSGDYYEGINTAVDEMIAYLSGNFVNDEEPAKNDNWAAVIFIVIIIIIILSRFFRGGGTTFTGGGTTYWGRGFGGFGGFGGGGGSGGFGGFGGGSFGGGGASGRW